VSPEELGKAVYCPAQTSVKEGSRALPQSLLENGDGDTLQSQALYDQ